MYIYFAYLQLSSLLPNDILILQIVYYNNTNQVDTFLSYFLYT